MDADFLREEREHLERGKGTRLYETTAWSLPLAFGIDAEWTDSRPEGRWTDAPVPPVEGSLEHDRGAVAYVIDGAPDAVPGALADLFGAGIAVRVAEKPFRVAGSDHVRGSLLVRREGQPETLVEALERIAAARGVTIEGVPTFRAEKGPDLGGHRFHALIAPRIGVWAGWPVAPAPYGALWRLLDEEVRYRFNALDLARFATIDLGRYNVLVFPPTIGVGYAAILGPAGIDRLRRWIEAGGTAIGIGSGAAFLAAKSTELTAARLRREALDRYPPVVLGPSAEIAERAGRLRARGVTGKPASGSSERSPYDYAPLIGPGARPFARGVASLAPTPLEPVPLGEWVRPWLPPGREKPKPEDLQRADERLRRFAPRGVFVRAELDPEQWLTWGLGERTLPVLLRGSDALVAEPPVEVAARFASIDRLHLGGLLWPEAAGRIAGTAYATREAVGRGQVILFLGEPEFRGWTLGTRRLLLNALLLGPGLGTRWSAPW